MEGLLWNMKTSEFVDLAAAAAALPISWTTVFWNETLVLIKHLGN